MLRELETPIALDDINIAELPSIALDDRSQLPKVCGIYFVVRKKAVLYIGQSLNINDRWKNHHILKSASKLDNVSIAYWQVPAGHLDNAERILIDEYQPTFNRQLSERLTDIDVIPSVRVPVWVFNDSECSFTRYLLGGINMARMFLDTYVHKGDEIFWPSPENRGVNLCVTRAIYTPAHPHGIRQSIRVKVTWDSKAQDVYESEYLVVRQKSSE